MHTVSPESSSSNSLELNDYGLDAAHDNDIISSRAPLLSDYSQDKPQLKRLPRSPISLVHLGAALAVVALIVLAATSLYSTPRAQYRPSGFSAARDQTRTWLSNSSNEGVVPFEPSIYPARIGSRELALTLSVKSFVGLSGECLEEWIARGVLCAEMGGRFEGERAPTLDVLWTWVNGSEGERLTEWRAAVSEEVEEGVYEKTSKVIVKTAGSLVAKHFRDHDELRYSIRSVVAAFPPSALRRLHLVVGDSPDSSPGEPPRNFSTVHLAQVPHWLNFDEIELGTPGMYDGGDERDLPSFVVHPHSEIFKTSSYDPQEEVGDDAPMSYLLERDEIEAQAWRKSVLPSFNSLAIESQLANVPDIADTVLSMNDDFFVLQNLSVSDIASPLTGPVFRIQRGLGVKGIPMDVNIEDPDGEWRGLKYTNWLLDQRFGVRERPYLVHEGKSVSTPILREIQDVFLEQLTATAEARFRGKAPYEVQSSFMLVHYTIEKHREALLWSFFVARHDADQDGYYSPSERKLLLSELGYGPEHPMTLNVSAPLRTTLSSLPTNLIFAGLDLPLRTDTMFSSLDGYAHFESLVALPPGGTWPSFSSATTPLSSSPVCILDYSTCLTPSFTQTSSHNLSIDSIFKRVAFEYPKCGDCIIVHLLSTSSLTGLSSFLPPPSPSPPLTAFTIGSTPSYPATTFLLPPLSSPRSLALSLIQRYAYTIGSSTTHFISIRESTSLARTLSTLSTEGEGGLPTWVALNDDMYYRSMKWSVDAVDRVLKGWFEVSIGGKTKWEK